VPLLLLAIATVIGGWVNTVTMNGRVVDDYTDAGIKDASISHGARSVNTDEGGSFTFPELPRVSTVRVSANGYFVKGVPTTEQQIRMSPTSFTVQVNEVGDPQKWIVDAEIRQGDKLLDKTNEGGNKAISPHPGKDAKLLICKEGYDRKEIEAKGVAIVVELTPGPNACPPLPTPSPAPSPTGSPSPSPGASPSPAPSPSPTASP
jgi:hypothetical protein